MELIFLAILVFIMAYALASGYPVAFALPGSAILTIGLAAGAGALFAGNPDAYFHSGGAWQWLSAGVSNFRGVYWEVERDTLIAIPLFIFMGIMLQRSKLAEDLLVTMARMFGPVPGGLGISVVFVGALLAATTGIVGATVVAMGLISLPAMMRNKYSNALSTGVIAASGTLGQIIPPSIVLIILADQLASAVDQASTARKELYKENTGELVMPSAFDVSSTSAGEMFLGAFIPGLALVALYMIYILTIAIARPKLAPSVPYEGEYDRAFFAKVAITLVPPLGLIFLVLGSIIGGVATVNQAGAIGAAGALVMAGYRLYEGRKDAYQPAILALVSVALIGFIVIGYGPNVKKIVTARDAAVIAAAAAAVVLLLTSLVWSGVRAYKIDNTLRDVMLDTAKTTSLVFIILLGAAMLTSAFRAFGGEDLVKDFLTGLPGGFWAQFTIVMLVIFVLGFFLDFIEIAVVVVPIVAPILLMDPGANVTAVWLGVMIGLNIQTSFLTPPFGFALFYLRGVAPAAVKTIQMYKGVVPFISLQLLALVIVGLTPQMVNYLPTRLSLTSEQAPPPRNPALQQCMETTLFSAYDSQRDRILAAIAAAGELDTAGLPKNAVSRLNDALKKAENTFMLVEAVRKAGLEFDAFAEDYRALHVQVREIQGNISRARKEAQALETASRRLPREADFDDERERIKSRIAQLAGERKALESRIPANWAEENGKFNKLRKAETKARQTYRRNADQAYEPIRELLKTMSSADALTALDKPVRGLAALLDGSIPPKRAIDRIKDVEKLFQGIPEVRPVTRHLSKMRRNMRGKTPKLDQARKDYDEALAALSGEIEWRSAAARNVVPGLRAYEASIARTIGLRQQARMPRDLALEIAGCRATPRDLTLQF